MSVKAAGVRMATARTFDTPKARYVELVPEPRPGQAINPLKAAILAAFARGERVTTNSIRQATGRSRSEVHRHLHELRAEGWITWDDGTRGAVLPTFECAWPDYMLAVTW